MIRSEWHVDLPDADRQQVLDLVGSAGRYDAEAGFSRIDPAEVSGDPPDGVVVHHLLVRIHPDEELRDRPEALLAAYGRLTMAGSDATLQLVVHPGFRSRGIGTMLVESLGSRVGADGWGPLRSGRIRSWAYADHPAAERLARRFSLPVVDRTWKLLRHLTGPFAVDLPALTFSVDRSVTLRVADLPEARPEVIEVAAATGVDPVGLLARLQAGGDKRVLMLHDATSLRGVVVVDDAVPVESRYPVGRVHAVLVGPTADERSATLRMLLMGALQELRSAGAAIAELHIDPTDEPLTAVCRALAFEQDQVDVRYEIPPEHAETGGAHTETASLEQTEHLSYRPEPHATLEETDAPTRH